MDFGLPYSNALFYGMKRLGEPGIREPRGTLFYLLSLCALRVLCGRASHALIDMCKT
jgi:hypothetical protein